MEPVNLFSPSSKFLSVVMILSLFACSSNKGMYGYKTSHKKKSYSKKKKAYDKKKKAYAKKNYSKKEKTNTSIVNKNSPKPNLPKQTTAENNEFPEFHYENCNAELGYVLGQRGLRKEHLSMRIDKSEYKLSIYGDGRLLKEYPVVFGENPRGDKLMQGDMRTPEGQFKVRAFYPHEKWEKFIWINYPTAQSYQKHKAAKDRGIIPSTASIGGEIGIHGVPDDKNYAITERQNWTLGCIAMKNQDVNELYAFVSKDMKITIRN